MNITYSPSYRSKFTRTSGKSYTIYRPSDSTAAYLGVAATASGKRPGHCFLIDKLHVRGQTVSTTANERTILVIKNDGGSTVATLTFIAPNGSAAAAQASTDWEIPINGRLVIPENHTIETQSTEPAGTNAPVTTGMTTTIHGHFEPVTQAARMGLYFGDTTATGNYFIAGAVPANTTATELVAARAGKAIRVLGYCASGQISTATGSLLISHYDGTTDRGIYKFNFQNAVPSAPLRQFAQEDFEIPIGESIRYTATANAVERSAFWIWGCYTDAPTTFNPDGFHGISGTATAGGAGPPGTITDTAQKWTVNYFANRRIEIISGTGAGQFATIASNTATEITITGAWPTATPDATSVYRITGDGASGSGGTVTYTATTLVDTAKTFKTNQWAGYLLRSGASTATIESNSATVLTLLGAGWVGGTPSAGDAYTISPMTREGGDKWWTFIDNVNADATDTAYRVVDDRHTRYASVQCVQLSADTNAAASTRPGAIAIVSAAAARKGSGVADAGPGLWAGLDAVSATATRLSAAYIMPSATVDYHSVISGIDMPVFTGISGTVCQVEVAHGVAGFSMHLSGRFTPDAPPLSLHSKAGTSRYMG